jgi:hypothetical protein
MSTEPAIRRYRRWYGRLLGLYPARFRDRFAEGMEQTFTDLCRERGRDARPLPPFVLWMFIETSAGIIKENLVPGDRPLDVRRPLGITLLVILAIVGIPVLLFGSYIWIVVEEVGGVQLLTAVAVLLLAPLFLAFAFGAWTLKPWAWLLGLVVGVATIVVMAVMLMQEMTNIIDEAPMLEIISGGIIGVAVIGLFLLRRPDVRAVFGRA